MITKEREKEEGRNRSTKIKGREDEGGADK